MPFPIPHHQVEHLVKLPKVLYRPFPGWRQSPNNAAFLVRELDVYDLDGATLPGLTVAVCCRLGPIAAACKDTYTLFQRHATGKARIFQIEVAHPGKRTHAGPPRLYGPHIHYGERVHNCGTRRLGCPDADRPRWFHRFCRHTNIHIETSQEGGEQMLLDDVW